MQSATRSPTASRSSGWSPGAEHAEVLHPGLAVAAEQPRRDLLDHAQPEVLEHRHRRRQLDLAAALVERRRASLPLSRLVLQADHERLAARLEPLEAARCRATASAGVVGALVVLGEARAPARRELAPAARPWRAIERARAARRPTCARARRPRARARGSRRSGRPPAAWTRKCTRTRSPSPSTGARRPRRSRSARGSSVAQRARAGRRRSARAAARRSATRCGRRGSRRPSSRTWSPSSASSATTARAQVVGRRGEQLVLRERVEQRDRGLVVVRALDQVLGGAGSGAACGAAAASRTPARRRPWW